MYDCYYGWMIFYSQVVQSETDLTSAWSGSGTYYTCVTDSATEPDPPDDPTCAAYWEASWNGTSWEKYEYYRDVYALSAWACSGTDYATGWFEIGTTPADPPCQES
jgi:hypothetical protein